VSGDHAVVATRAYEVLRTTVKSEHFFSKAIATATFFCSILAMLRGLISSKEALMPWFSGPAKYKLDCSDAPISFRATANAGRCQLYYVECSLAHGQLASGNHFFTVWNQMHSILTSRGFKL
jgi:hypothetical protein